MSTLPKTAAQVKQALPIVTPAANAISSGAQTAGEAWSALPDSVRSGIINALIGGTLVGGGTAAMNYAGGGEVNKDQVLRNALMGAAGGALTPAFAILLLGVLGKMGSSDLLALANARYLRQLPELEVYGPAGTELWFEKLHSSFPYLEKMRVSLHELKPMDSLSLKGCDIFAEEAKHSVTALAYRVEWQGKAVVYSGDTEPYQRIASLAEGADLLIHECSFPEPFDVTNHTTPRKLGSLIKDVGRIVLTHFYPQAEGQTDQMAREVRELSSLPAAAGWDLMTLVI
jgi:ribonuclease Z